MQGTEVRWTRESNGVNLSLTFTTSIGYIREMESRNKKDLNKT